jgi:hypothetical protein
MNTSRSSRYLNVILTVNAVLLSALVYTQLAAGPAWSSSAWAQTPPDGGIPNAAAQRQQAIEEMKGIRASVDAMRKSIEGGKMKVAIGNVDEIKSALKADQKAADQKNNH